VRTRFNNKWEKTRGNIKVEKIVKAVGQFPLLHAYGVGFAQFRNIPEATRSKCIDYARYMLAFELDDEIDAAYRFFKAIGISKYPRNEHYVRSQYVEHLYATWRKDVNYPEYIPLGVFGLAALLLGTKIRIIEGLKPHFLIPILREKREKVESYLDLRMGYKRWDDADIYWNFNGTEEDAEGAEESEESEEAEESEGCEGDE
jgi:hypothetical protein